MLWKLRVIITLVENEKKKFMNLEEWKKKPLRLVEKKGLREPMIKFNRIGVNDALQDF